MKNKMLGLVAFIIVGLLYANLQAITVNPASNVTADSANTGLTIIYRDSNGDFSSRDVSVRSIIPSNTTSSRLHLVALTTTQLLTTVPAAIGDFYAAVNDNGDTLQHICVSSGTGAGAVVIATATNMTTRCIN